MTAPFRNRPVFVNQANPTPIFFGNLAQYHDSEPITNVRFNFGRFAEANGKTRSVAGGGTNVSFGMNSSSDIERSMRQLCIDAVYGMRDVRPFSENPEDVPAAMGVLLSQVEDKNWRSGSSFQCWIHSSVKGGLPEGRATSLENVPQARLHPALAERMKKKGLVHHFSSMCAEMALLSNFLYDYPDSLGPTGPITSGGHPLRIMTYNTTFFHSRPGEERKDGTGRFFVPCQHIPSKCGQRGFGHFGNSGCLDVLRELGVEVMGRGEPSESDLAILAEQAERWH